MSGQESAQIFLDKFRIIKCLNKNINSAVYIGRHIYLDKKIFLKTLESNNLNNPTLLKRFEREAKTLARLDHPNIINIYDFGTWESIYYISFEYFESNNLRRTILGPPLSDERKTAIIRQIVLGLHAVHSHKIVHRDIKPENILLDEKFQVKIADFGLALFNDTENTTHPASIVGTPAYMSPEQIRGEKLTCASDFFSLGIIIFELYGLKNPFLGKSVVQTLNNIMNANIKDYQKQLKNIPEETAKLVKGLLQRDVSDRKKAADDLLKPYLDNEIKSESIKLDSPKPIVNVKRIVAGVIAILTPILVYLIFSLIPKDEVLTERTVQEKIGSNTNMDTVLQNQLFETRPGKENISIKVESPKITSDNKKRSRITENNKVNPTSLPGHLSVECLPWAYVYLDSILIDLTPLPKDIDLTAGSHILILKHPEYPDYTQNVFIKSGEKTLVAVNLDTLIGYLDCKIFPWGDIFVDNKPMGQSPLEKPIRLFPGNYELTIKNTGYRPFMQPITMDGGDTLCIEYDFAAQIANAKKE